ncbi:MAG: hypothetical protein AB7D06_11210 [Pedobacter sp.]
MKLFKLFMALLFSLLATGCMTMRTPPYEASINNYEPLQKGHYKKVALGDFSVSGSNLNLISVRGNPLKSSVNDSFGSYLKFALEEELYKAGLLADDATCIISGVLMENDIDTAFVTASGHISANLVIKEKGEIVYDKVLTATHEWESNFVGAIAIPRARDNYPFIVREFINALVEDSDFKKALTKGEAVVDGDGPRQLSESLK